MEAAAEASGIAARIKVKDTRAALIEHFAGGRFIHPGALIAPPAEEVSAWAHRFAAAAPDAEEQEVVLPDPEAEASSADDEAEFRDAAE
ncbi:hypothetical protein HFO69_26945 [Rhizobium laguerreae]|uniref:hypothetical protein n=1 Tax=Rhizobium laguerreae TaxID=1076926 RepID=UPI001C9138A2|nr:hypothetical protein [Rhizobium laguerreae]MBY3101303.1 hypothetical protein [Rhizobium laguerreae]